MVILADELLEEFFGGGFGGSFVLVDQPQPVPPLPQRQPFVQSGGASVRYSMPPAPRPQPVVQAAVPVVGGQGQIPRGLGLRGVLDNIVNDGMRVAAEVRRRMEELDAAAAPGGVQEEEEEGAEGGVQGGDRELLRGMEVEVGGEGEMNVEGGGEGSHGGGGGLEPRVVGREGSTRGVVEFEGGM